MTGTSSFQAKRSAKRERSLIAIAAFAALAAPAFAAEREPVLKQVTAPHSYYWREMYIPQLTSGPSGLAWSADGKALVFSMQGRLWRQSIDSKTAAQITDGAGYDYQPDLSPDGRSVVFARRQGDAINLVIRDLRTNKETPVTQGDAVNIEPRWSPDGRIIAYVTTEESGNFHIALATEEDGAWRSRRWRPETVFNVENAPRRYYYAASDHELSPAWSADGASLIFVSNEGVRHGAGKIVSQKLDLSAPPEIIRDEETNWKARPDVSPDGRRVAYASYLGRQWQQLWLTTTTPGGFPMPFTYGAFDITAPRWSPDGSKIAFINNEAGGLAIEMIDMIDGARTKMETTTLNRRQDFGALTLSLRDNAGAPVAARVQVRGADGRDYAPKDALMRADDFRDPSDPTETHYFHAQGDATIAVPPGVAEIRVWRGLTATPVVKSIEIAKRGATTAEITLDDIAADFSRWKSGDVHVHMNYGGAYRERVPGLAKQADAEALDLAFNLIVNKEQRVPDIDAFTPTPIRPDGASAVIAQAQEFHTSVWGHLGLIGLEEHLLISDYVGYPETAVASHYPDNATIARRAHEQGALVGYVHPYDPPAPDPSGEGRLTHSLPADVALGLIDYIEVVGFSDHRTVESVWHRLLNCGFRMPAAGGTDAMANYASLRGPIGLDRTYVDLGEAPADPAAFTRAWLDGLKAGRSFATNSALLDFKLAGEGPGGEINLNKGAHRLSFSVAMASAPQIDTLEIVVNGKVMETIALSDDGRRASATGEIEIAQSSWVSLRASGKGASADVFDLYPYAVTTPVYVTVDGKAQRSRADADYFIAWIDRLIAYTQSADFNTEKERAIVLDNFRKARAEFERRR